MTHHLTPLDWSEVATKRDLDQLADRLRVEFHKGFGGLRGEVGGLRREIGGLRGEIGRLRTQVRAQTLNLLFGLLIANAVMVGLLLAIFKYA